MPSICSLFLGKMLSILPSKYLFLPSMDNWTVCSSLSPLPSPLLSSPHIQVACLPQHNLCTNLRLTALVSKLATFPHPLLKAVLLHPDVVVQPTCLTLAQAISTARLR